MQMKWLHITHPFLMNRIRLDPGCFRVVSHDVSDPEAQENVLAWEKLESFSQPTITVLGLMMKLSLVQKKTLLILCLVPKTGCIKL